jgi:small subunit ribosomal protein S16
MSPRGSHLIEEQYTMAVRIRLRRTGRKKAPMFRIVVADSRSPRDGRFIEIVGQYAPRQGENALNLRTERVTYWLDNGALPTDTVRSILRRAGILKARHEQRLGRTLQAKAVPIREDAEASEGGAA